MMKVVLQLLSEDILGTRLLIMLVALIRGPYWDFWSQGDNFLGFLIFCRPFVFSGRDFTTCFEMWYPPDLGL